MQAARGTAIDPETTAAPAGRSRARVWALFATIAATAYAVDLVTKVLALDRLEGQPDVPVVGDLLTLTLVKNPGAAFSTGTQFTVALSCIAIAATVVVLVLSLRVRSRLWAVALGLLLAGVTGNLTDRLFRDPGPMRGHVIDFLMLPNWPVFNVADVCINVAAGLILVQAFRGVRLDGTRDRDHEPDDQSGDRPGDRPDVEPDDAATASGPTAGDQR